MIYYSFIALLLITVASAQSTTHASPFTTDAEWHFINKLESTWKKADETKDGVLTLADKGGWHHNKAKDTNQDDSISLEEFKAPRFLKNAIGGHFNVVYKEASGEKCLLDIYIPKKKKGALSPVLYFTHGGGWAAGNKELNGNMTQVFEAMLAEGITCVSAAYRLVKNAPSHPVVMEDCVIDCKDGLRFIAKHAEDLKVDMEKVCVFGNSAGGHICLMLAYSSPESFTGAPDLSSYTVTPVAGINWFGPVTFLDGSLFIHPMNKENPGNPNRFAGRMMKNGKSCDYADAPEAQQKLMKKLSPLTYLTKDSAPLLTIHGDKDTTIPHMHSELLQKKAQEVGADVTYLPVIGAGHGFHNKCNPSISEITQEMVNFTVKHFQ